MRVDYQRITEEAYEGREEEAPNRRTALVGGLIIGFLALLFPLLAVVFVVDLHRSSVQMLDDRLRDLEHWLGIIGPE